ncbi:MAG: lipocalin family protein [Simkania sp.]|nr:lipocalin family protein [Simkania sp.]MCB1075675.1 lipocalin family protein [Simkania sp.]MCP5491390.1 lipocalin family protein [Chlamydiales bacterium]
MKKIFTLLLSYFVGCAYLHGEVKTMESVDLSRYLGQWYEIALLPNRFEKKCIEGAIAKYSFLNDGLIKVINSCKTRKGDSQATGVAWVVDHETNAKLKVSFVPLARYFQWFGGDYWILYVDPDYQFAVVGDPSRKYLWLLARNPSVSEEVYHKFLTVASENAFDTKKIVRVRP